MDWVKFFNHGMGEGIFTKPLSMIDDKIMELVRGNNFDAIFQSSLQKLPDFESLFPGSDTKSEDDGVRGRQTLENPCFKSIYRAAQEFDLLKWMFEKREDILATFVRRLTGPAERLHPPVIRMRARRD